MNDKRTYKVLASVKKARFYVVLLMMLSVSIAGGGQDPFKDDHPCLNHRVSFCTDSTIR